MFYFCFLLLRDVLYLRNVPFPFYGNLEKNIYSQFRGPSEKQEKEDKDFPGSPGGSVVAMREHQVAKNSFPDLAPEIGRTVPKACVMTLKLVVIPVK